MALEPLANTAVASAFYLANIVGDKLKYDKEELIKSVGEQLKAGMSEKDILNTLGDAGLDPLDARLIYVKARYDFVYVFDRLHGMVSEQLQAGVEKRIIIDKLSSEAGLDKPKAEQLVNVLRKKESTKDIGCGFFILMVGTATAYSIWSSGGGLPPAVGVAIGVMIALPGIRYILRGIKRKITKYK